MDGVTHRIDPKDIQNITQIKTGGAKQTEREDLLIDYLNKNDAGHVYEIGWVPFKDIKPEYAVDAFMETAIGKTIGREAVTEMVSKFFTHYSKFPSLSIMMTMIGAALLEKLHSQSSKEGDRA